MYERALAHGGQKTATDSLELELQEVGATQCGRWEPNMGPLQ